MKRVGVLLLVVGLASMAGLPPGHAAGIGAVPILTGLDFPAGFTFAPDGRIFYAETYEGEIHLADPAGGTDTVFYTLTGSDGTQGVLGLALAPGYPSVPYLYAYVTRTVGTSLVNQIVRIKDVGGVGTQPRVIFQTDAGTDHFGGRILFGSDGLLYALVGDGGDSATAQDLASTNGKLLRMTPTGGVPPGNPFAGSLVWAYGIRNSIGFGFDTVSGSIFADENGPECNDELNLILKGKNYGWGPTATCSTPPPPPRNTNQDGPRPMPPLEYVATPTAPTGATFCTGCGLPGAEGTLLYGTFNTGNIHEVTLTADRRHVATDAVVYTHSSFVLSLERGPDGSMYFSDGTAIYQLVAT